jgi:CYTH domain-containing protein
MSVVRRFLIAPALVRLIRKERGGSRITEGYFAPQAGRTSFVRVDGQNCHLVLTVKGADGVLNEERTEVPRAHGDALLDVCPGKAAYDRTALSVAGREVLLDRYVSPGNLDVVSVGFDNENDARGFAVPAWFGREVSEEAAYERQAVALEGVPQAGDIALSNAALDAVLDLLEPRFGFGRFGNSSPRPPEPRGEGDEGVVNSLRRIAGGGAAAAPAAAAAAAPEAAPEQAAEQPAPAHEPVVEPAPGPAHDEQRPTDARIDDVIESLSQALGAAIQQPQEPAQPAGGEDPGAGFERWTVRPRRTQPQT